MRKKDLMIYLIDEACFRVLYRRRVLLFFSIWIEMTDQEAENTPEKPIEFKTLKEAINFCNYITS